MKEMLDDFLCERQSDEYEDEYECYDDEDFYELLFENPFEDYDAAVEGW